MRDATERRTAQETLRALNETLEAKVVERTSELEITNNALASKELEIRSVIEHMADGVVTFDDHGVIRAANSKVEEIFGFAPPSLRGGHVSLLIPALDGLASDSMSRDGSVAATAISAVGGETYGRHRSGNPIPLDVAISDFRIEGKRFWTAIVRDISGALSICDLERPARGEEANKQSRFRRDHGHEIRTR